MHLFILNMFYYDCYYLYYYHYHYHYYYDKDE